MYKGIEITLKLMINKKKGEQLNYVCEMIEDYFAESVITPLGRVNKIF